MSAPMPPIPEGELIELAVVPGHGVKRSLVIEGPPQEWVADCACLWVSKQGSLEFVSGSAWEHLRVVWQAMP